MSCPPGGCASWGASRLCKPLPPICLGCEYDPGELQMLWFCWRAHSTGEYAGLTPVDLAPGLIDISGKTNIAKIIEYCQQRGTLAAPFTTRNKFSFSGAGTSGGGSGGSGPSLSFGVAISGGFGSGGFGSSGFLGGGTHITGGGTDVVVAPAAGGTSGGGGGGAGACGCTPDNPNLLTVAICTELNCQAGSPEIELTVCGGTPPYTWSLSGGEGSITLTQSGTNNRNARVVPPPPPDISGEAYQRIVYSKGPPNCDTHTNARVGYSCTDVSDETCNQIGVTTDCLGAGVPFCRDVSCPDDQSVACWDPTSGGVCGSAGECNGCDKVLAGEGTPCDVRTQQMKDDGCIPCGVAMEGLNITVTDDVGAQVATVISA